MKSHVIFIVAYDCYTLWRDWLGAYILLLLVVFSYNVSRCFDKFSSSYADMITQHINPQMARSYRNEINLTLIFLGAYST